LTSTEALATAPFVPAVSFKSDTIELVLSLLPVDEDNRRAITPVNSAAATEVPDSKSY
jgi:hypothetical protein